MTALLATMLVVVLLLSALSFVLLDLGAPVPDDDDDDGDGGAPPAGWLTIDEDTTWQGVNASMGGPVRIEDGSTLTLERCDLTVDIEDLVLWRAPVIDVRQGGGLALNGSRVRLRVDQNLSGALYVGGDLRFGNGYPHVSRVVNLLHAKRPVLAFNVSFRGSTTDLVVLGQRSWNSQMGQLARLPGRPGVWEHHEVDLSPLSGGVARVAIAPLDRGFGALYLSDARVLDDGATPTGELPLSPRECFEGWERAAFTQFFLNERYGDYVRLDALVESEGDVSLEDSTIEAPAGLPRMRDVEDGSRDWSDPEITGDSMYHRSLIWAHVQLSGGTLDVTGSRLLNVPVRADGARLSIEGSRLAGDADLLTLRRCDGGARDTDFHREPYAFAEFESSERSRESWAISVEELGAGTITLDRCTLEGAALGLYLMNASVGVERCAFSGSTVACIWSRDSAIAGGWERLNATCTFDQGLVTGPPMDGDQGGGLRFLEVHTCRATMTWLNMPTRDRYYYVYFPSDAVPIEDATDLIISAEDDYLLLLPRLAVTANGTEQRYGRVPLVASYQWGANMVRRENLTVEQGTRQLTLWFDLESVGLEDYRELMEHGGVLRGALAIGQAPGDVVLNISVRNYILRDLLDTYSFRVRVAIDGSTVSELELWWEDLIVDYTALNYLVPLAIPPGSHVISLELLGREPLSTSSDILFTTSMGVLRADGSSSSDDVESHLDVDGWLLVDPGVALALDDIPTEEVGFYYQYYGFRYTYGLVRALLWPGSELAIQGISAPEDTYMETYLDAHGAGNVTVTDCSSIYLVLSSVGATVTLDRLLDCHVSLDLDGGTGWLGPTGAVGLFLGLRNGASFQAQGCALMANTSSSEALTVRGSRYSATFTDCTLSSNVTTNSSVSTVGPCRMLFQNCSFVNVTLKVAHNARCDEPSSLALDNCTFAGELSFLVVEAYDNGAMGAEGLDLVTTSVTFDGEGTGALVTDGHLATARDCTLRPGAALLVFHPYTVGPADRAYAYDSSRVITLGLGWAPPFYESSLEDTHKGLVFEAVVGEVPYAYDGRTVTFALVEYGEVVWFVESRIAGDVVEAEAPDWKDASYLVQQAIGRISGNVDWWIGWP